MKVQVKIVYEDGLKPEKGTRHSAGYDLRAAKSTVIMPHSWEVVPTSVHIELPHGYEAQVRSRSGLAAKHGVFVLNSPGTIDSDYRGEVKVILMNCSDDPFIVQKGDRIAQLVIKPVFDVEWTRVESVEVLSDTERGAGGFGSTGTK